ncbi:MAG: hypothetical protein GYB21_17030, partial [Oceanospirillales bacterium]|nr:hypothetical protein [Oceanospirillales bacterium]
ELGDAVPVLEPCLTSSLIAAMERETGGEFCSAPKLDGQCRHAGVATVAANVHNAKAVLTDSLKALLSQMEQGLTQLESPVLAGTIRPYAGRPGVGYGWARSARGWLLHRVELVKEHVARWQILAPTDWNFHTDGIVAKRLTGVRVARESAEALVGDLILSLDPCVEFEVRVKDA